MCHKQSLEWRDVNNVSSYRSWEPPEVLAKDYILRYVGEDREGFPGAQDTTYFRLISFLFYNWFLLQQLFMCLLEGGISGIGLMTATWKKLTSFGFMS